jgi:hypothetical protein
VLVFIPVTSVPPAKSLDEQKDDAIMKQLITLSCENCVALSVQSMNKKQKKKVPIVSEIIAANHLFETSSFPLPPTEIG